MKPGGVAPGDLQGAASVRVGAQVDDRGAVLDAQEEEAGAFDAAAAPSKNDFEFTALGPRFLGDCQDAEVLVGDHLYVGRVGSDDRKEVRMGPFVVVGTRGGPVRGGGAPEVGAEEQESEETGEASHSE